MICLNKSLYGLKHACNNWFEKLRNGLKDRGFIQSQVNQCSVFYREECIVLTNREIMVLSGGATRLRTATAESLCTEISSLQCYIVSIPWTMVSSLACYNSMHQTTDQEPKEPI